MIIFSYFNDGIRTKLLELITETSEKAVTMFDITKNVLQKNGLEFGKMIWITYEHEQYVYNMNSMFGGKDRGGKNNLYYLLKQGYILYQ